VFDYLGHQRNTYKGGIEGRTKREIDTAREREGGGYRVRLESTTGDNINLIADGRRV